MRGVRSPDDHRKPLQGIEADQAELRDHGIEGAEVAAVAPEHALRIERRGAEALCDAGDVGWWDEQEDRRRIDETADEPRTGDPVHFGARTGYPDGAAFPVPLWKVILVDDGQT